MGSILNIGEDIVNQIFSYLPIKQMIKSERISKEFNVILDQVRHRVLSLAFRYLHSIVSFIQIDFDFLI